MTPVHPVGRIEAFVVSYVAAVVASTAALDAMALVYGITQADGWRKIALVIPNAIFATMWFGIGASLFAIPAVIAGHPLALVVARRMPSARATAAVGAVAGPLVGCALLLLAGYGDDSPLDSTFEQTLFLAVPAIAAGGAVGWMAHRTVTSRTAGWRP